MRADLDEVVITSIRRDAEAPSCARQLLLDLLDSHEQQEDALLLASELVTNVVRHAPDHVDRIDLGVVTQPVLTISVTQAGGFPDSVGRSASPGGMGLRIVDKVSTCWGFSSDGDSLMMWFQLAG